MNAETTTEPVSPPGEHPKRRTLHVRGVGTCYMQGSLILVAATEEDAGRKIAWFEPGAVLRAVHWLSDTEAASLAHVFAGRCPDFVGIGATYYVGSGSYPYTIVEVPNDSTVVVTPDKFTGNAGDDQEYVPNPDAARMTFTRRKDGTWHREGDRMQNTPSLQIGERASYQDPCF